MNNFLFSNHKYDKISIQPAPYYYYWGGGQTEKLIKPKQLHTLWVTTFVLHNNKACTK